MRKPLSLPLPAERLIPHAFPMRWVERLIEFDGKEARVESCRLSGHPLFSNSVALPLCAMAELIAQAYAAVKGYQDLEAGLPVQKGFLVGIRRIEMLKGVPGTRPLSVHVRPAGMFGGFYLADGEVSLDGETIARGTVKLWVPGEEGSRQSP